MFSLSYEKLKAFYDVLVKCQNEDGYCMCTVQYAAAVADITSATGTLLPDRLERMGCVKVYRAVREPIVPATGQPPIKGGTRFTLIKLTDVPLTEELYDSFGRSEEAAKSAKRRRKQD